MANIKAVSMMMACVVMGLFSTPAMANNQAKINVVKQAYGEAIKCVNRDCNGDPVAKYTDASLKKAMAHAKKYAYLTNQDDLVYPCDFHHSYRELLGWAQDTPYGGFKMSQFKFTTLKNGRVQAAFIGTKDFVGTFKVQVAVTCSGNTCKISDIYNDGTSFKQSLNQCHLYQ